MNALFELGRLYRNDEGNEVWEIRDLEGDVVAADVASDHDAAWIADRALAGVGRVEVRLRGEAGAWDEVAEKADGDSCDHCETVCLECVGEWSIDHNVRRVWNAAGGVQKRVVLGRA